MKNKFKIFGIITFIVLIGFSMVACSDDDNNDNPFIGTWNGVDHEGVRIRVVIGPASWTVSWPDHPGHVIAQTGTNSGTYTRSGNTGTLIMQGQAVGTGTVSGNTLSIHLTGLGFPPITLSR